MVKLFRKLFNRTTLVIFIILIELAVILSLFFVCQQFDDPNSFLGSRYPQLAWIGYIDDLIILILSIINIVLIIKILFEQTDAEFKIPWLLILLIVPIVPPILYLIFGRKNIRKKDLKLLKSSDGLDAKYFLDKPNHDLLGEFQKTSNFLDNNSILCGHSNNKVQYFKNGQTFFPDMIEELKKAQQFIFIEFFIIGNGKLYSQIREILIEKAKQGVDVRIIYDDLGSVGILPGGEAEFLRKNGIKAFKFNKLKPFVSGVYNNRDHRKICVIDHRVGYTGGMNLADEYANLEERFGYWKDTMIKIEGSAINNLIHLFLTNFDLCSKKTSNHSQFLEYEYDNFNEPGFVYPFGHGPAPFFKERVGEETLTNIISSAQDTLYISSPYFIPSESLLYAVRRATLNGVKTYLFLPGIPDKKLVFHMAETYFKKLFAAGVHIMIYRPGFNHMKTLLADDKLAFVGTINCDYRSLVHHFECGAVLYNTPCCADIRDDFKEMLVDSEELKAETFKMSRFITFICMIIRPFASLL